MLFKMIKADFGTLSVQVEMSTPTVQAVRKKRKFVAVLAILLLSKETPVKNWCSYQFAGEAHVWSTVLNTV